MENNPYLNTETICAGEYFTDSVSCSHRFITPPNSYIRYATERKHDRLLYIANGRVKFDMFNSKPVLAETGSIVYIPYNIAYKTEWLGETQGEFYSINYTMTADANQRITLSSEIIEFPDCDTYVLSNSFRECYESFSENEVGYIIKCKYLFFRILHLLITSRIPPGKSKISKAIRYIESNYLDDFTVKDLADLCNLGECMFRRCFKNETGTSPVKYRNKLRIEKAYELLTADGRSVTEAMEMTGFYDASYFNKTFKIYMGKSPSECKKNYDLKKI